MSGNSDPTAVQPLGRAGSGLHLADPFTGLHRCPQCSAAKPTLRLKAVMPQDIDRQYNNDKSWAIYQCTSCGNPVNFLARMAVTGGFEYQRAHIGANRPEVIEMQPERREDFADWPTRAKRYIEQAVESLHAPDAAVMLAGSAIDAMLKEKGLGEGSVYKRIEQAVSDHLLTPEMGEWAHSVRLAANSPRHADVDDPHATTEQAHGSLEFARALGQFLFVLPARIARGREAAEQANPDALGV